MSIEYAMLVPKFVKLSQISLFGYVNGYDRNLYESIKYPSFIQFGLESYVFDTKYFQKD